MVRAFLLILTLLAGNAAAVTDIFTASGTWTAPAGVTSVDVEVWGGGGAGGGQNMNSDGGGGGGGGAYSRSTLTVVPGSSYPVSVGAGGIGVASGTGGAGGDSFFNNAATVFAKGGAGGSPSTGIPPAGGTGGAAAAGVGTTKFSGGNGGAGRNSNNGRGGPGGSSAGTAANGTSGAVVWATATASAAPAGGGIGGNGGNANGQNGFAPASGNGGGGGGAAEGTALLGGNGASGKVTITYVAPPAVTSITAASANPTTAASVSWTVVFNTSVTGVSSGNFSLAASGLGGSPAITSVTGSGTTWTVTASTGTGTGSLGLDMVNDTGLSATLANLPFSGEVYSVRPPAATVYYHDTTTGVAIGVDGPTNVVSGSDVVIPPIITASLTTANTCVGSARSRSHPTGPYTHSRWYLTTDYAVDTDIGANPSGVAVLRGAAGNTVAVSLYDYDPVSGAKVLIGSSAPLAINANTTPYAYTISSPSYTVPAGRRLMLEYEFNQAIAGDRARVYCQPTPGTYSYIAITESTTPATIDHFRILSSSSGLTCAANTLTVKACQDAACNVGYTSGVSGTLSATGTPVVNWDGTTGGAAGSGFAIASGASLVTKDVQVASAGTITFGIASSTLVPANATICNFGNNPPANDNCVFTANTAGFIFSDTATGAAYSIPDQVSGIASPQVYLRAVQASTADPAVCTPAIISQTTSVDMGYVCNDPGTCQPGNLATVNATSIAPAGTPVSLTFDANGSAPVTVRYDDVGQITLVAAKTLTPFGGATPVALAGSNAIVFAPHHFVLSGVTAGPIKAGNAFSATVTAYNGLAAPTVTANFGREDIPEGVTLSFNRCEPTGTAVRDGIFFSGTVGVFSGGAATATDLIWSEVGNGELVATLTSGDYLASGKTASGNTGTSGMLCNGGPGNVGPFVPDHFIIEVVDGCNGCGFSYSGQPYSVTVTAKNSLSPPLDPDTKNYDGSVNTSPNFANDVWLTDANALATPAGKFGVSAAPLGVTVNVAGDVLTVPKADFVSGVATLTGVPSYIFNAVATAPTTVKMRATDSVTAVTSSGFAEGTTEIRSGRIKLSNGHGSELLALPLTATVQFFNGATWVTSTTDSATAFDTNLSTAGGDLAANVITGLTGGITIAAPGVAPVAGGLRTFSLNPPGQAGSVNLTIGAPAYLPSNTARATFGVYKGNNEFIYLRENY